MIPDHWRAAALEPPTAWGGALGAGVLRASPEDFVVDEILGFVAGGDGPHALLRVRKRGANTEWVARELAKAVGCKPFDVGYAGLKDRNALTTQAFTVPRGRRTAEELLGLKGEGYDLSKIHEDTWEGKATYVVGADKGDLKTKQFWVEKETMLFVRVIETTRQDPQKLDDIRFTNYRPVGGAWIAAGVEVHSDGKKVFSEDYTDIQAGVKLDAAVFDPAQFSTTHWEK